MASIPKVVSPTQLMAEAESPMLQPSLSGALSDDIVVDGVRSHATLTPDGVMRWTEGGKERCVMVEREVLGVEVEEGRWIRVRCLVESGGGGWCGGGRARERVRRDFVLEMGADRAAEMWEGRFREVLDSLGRPKRLLFILNPFGGKGRARSIFHKEVKPLLVAAGLLDFVLYETKNQHHAQEMAYNLDLSRYDGIVCISGDGVLSEVLNGLLTREDWQTAIKMPLGIIPAGTGNGMLKSLLDPVGDACSVTNAVFTIIRGQKSDLDIATVSQGKTLFFSLLMLSWGLISDIDIESEKYRWMGSARFELYPLVRMMNLRKYNGHISFVPAPGYENHGIPIKIDNSTNILDRSDVDQYGYKGPKICFSSSDWRTIEGPFVSLWLHNVPWSNYEVMATPDAKFSDGYIDMILVKDCPKLALLSLLLKMNDGSHVKSPWVVYLKVKALRLEPGKVVGTDRGGIVDSDGEVLARGKGAYKCNPEADPMSYGPLIELQVEQGLATIFSPR